MFTQVPPLPKQVHPGQQEIQRSKAEAQVLSSLLEKCLNIIFFFSILSSKQIKSNTQVQFGIAHTRIPRTQSAEGSVATGVNGVFVQTRCVCRR